MAELPWYKRALLHFIGASLGISRAERHEILHTPGIPPQPSPPVTPYIPPYSAHFAKLESRNLRATLPTPAPAQSFGQLAPATKKMKKLSVPPAAETEDLEHEHEIGVRAPVELSRWAALRQEYRERLLDTLEPDEKPGKPVQNTRSIVPFDRNERIRQARKQALENIRRGHGRDSSHGHGR